MMESAVSTCPVPKEQQPLNEYQELQNSWFFRWATLDLREYAIQLIWVWIWCWLVAGPLAAASFSPQKYVAQFLICGSVGASIGVVLILIRLYLGWLYVRDRLASSTVFYEESGWYDGQSWTKPPEVLTRDRLLVSYQVQPILGRLHRTFGLLALFFTANGITWNFLCAA
jgi:hypothetical protein